MQQKQTNIWRRIVQSWLSLTSPDPRIFGPGIEDQERKRRSRLLSALLALVFIPVLLAAPTAIPVSSYWIPIISLIVLSVDRALSRANRAEDLAEARKRLGEQAHYMVEQKEKIDYGITVLKNAHARFANGKYKARAKLQNKALDQLLKEI